MHKLLTARPWRSTCLSKLTAGTRPSDQPDATRPPGAGAPVEGDLQVHLVLLGQLPDPFLQLRAKYMHLRRRQVMFEE